MALCTPLDVIKQNMYYEMVNLHFKYPILNHVVPPSDFAMTCNSISLSSLSNISSIILEWILIYFHVLTNATKVKQSTWHLYKEKASKNVATLSAHDRDHINYRDKNISDPKKLRSAPNHCSYPCIAALFRSFIPSSLIF